jgi:hypothetical protein
LIPKGTIREQKAIAGNQPNKWIRVITVSLLLSIVIESGIGLPSLALSWKKHNDTENSTASDKSDGKSKDKASDQGAGADKGGAASEVPAPSAAAAESQKLLKTLKTPFATGKDDQRDSQPTDSLSSLTLESHSLHLSLAGRFAAPQLYLPGHMTIGKTCEFSVKAKPGSWVALAMADKNSGAKPIVGHNLRLGSDRKVVAAVQVPASGVAVLSVDTPIEGDLVGQCLYFEAAVWSKPDLSDTEIATVIPSESHDSGINGVMIAADTADKKKGLRLVPDSTPPSSAAQHAETNGLTSGKP